MTWFRRFFGDARPVRRDIRLNASPDGKTLHAGTAECITVSPEGSIDRTVIASFYACGCTSEARVGGACTEQGCANVVCHGHFTTCATCLRGLCTRCTFLFTPTSTRNEVHLCHRCHASNGRWQRMRTALSAVHAYLERL